MTLTIRQLNIRADGYYQPNPGAIERVVALSATRAIANGVLLDVTGAPDGHEAHYYSETTGNAQASLRRVSRTETILQVQAILPEDSITLPMDRSYSPTTFPVYVNWPDGEAQEPQTVERTSDDSIGRPPVEQRRNAAAAAIRRFIDLYREKIHGLNRYIDVDPMLPAFGGKVLKAAVNALHHIHADTSRDPDDTLKIVEAAILGPLDATSEDAFAAALVGLKEKNPGGWIMARLWVTPDGERTALADAHSYGVATDGFSTLNLTWLD